MVTNTELEPNSSQTSALGGNLIQKLTLTFPEVSHGGGKSISRCCNLKKVFKQMGILLSFHVLNVLLVIYGAFWMVLFLPSFVLVPLWIMFALCIRAVIVIVKCLPPRLAWLRFVAYFMMYALYLASCCSMYTAFGQYIYVAGIVDVFAIIVRHLVRMDSRLMKFISPVASCDSNDDAFDFQKCARRFVVESMDGLEILPFVRMTRRLWLAILYFTIVKVMIAALSGAVVILAVILPLVAICSGGDAPSFASRATLDDNTITYIVFVVFSCMVGAVGLPMVAMLSVEMTRRFCGEWESEQEQSPIQEKSASPLQYSIPVTPPAEASATSFSDIETAKSTGSAYAV